MRQHKTRLIDFTVVRQKEDFMNTQKNAQVNGPGKQTLLTKQQFNHTTPPSDSQNYDLILKLLILASDRQLALIEKIKAARNG